MTTVKQDIETVLELYGQIAAEQPEAVSLLKSVYIALFGEPIKKGCGKCLTKAFYKIQKHIFLNKEQLNLDQMKQFKDRAFVLKSGRTLQLSFGGDALTNANMTEEAAARVLSANPGLVRHFETYPKDKDGNLDLSSYTDKKAAKKVTVPAPAKKADVPVAEVPKKTPVVTEEVPAAEETADKTIVNEEQTEQAEKTEEQSEVPEAEAAGEDDEVLFVDGKKLGVGEATVGMALFMDAEGTIPAPDDVYTDDNGDEITVEAGVVTQIVPFVEETPVVTEEVPAAEAVNTDTTQPKATKKPAAAEKPAKPAKKVPAAKPEGEVSQRTLQRRAAKEKAEREAAEKQGGETADKPFEVAK